MIAEIPLLVEPAYCGGVQDMIEDEYGPREAIAMTKDLGFAGGRAARVGGGVAVSLRGGERRRMTEGDDRSGSRVRARDTRMLWCSELQDAQIQPRGMLAADAEGE